MSPVDKPATAVPEEEAGYSIVMPPEMHIPCSVQDITDVFRANVDHTEKSTFNDVCKLIEACSITELMGIRKRVKKNFRFFSAAALGRKLPTRRGRHLPKEDAMDEQELVFLKDFFELMDIAHYHCLTQRDWKAARAERFLLDMPIKLNWDYMDSRMLNRFFSRFPERRRDLYVHTDRALIFTRGVGTVKKQDLFIAQKIDLLVEYLIAFPAKQLWAKLWPMIARMGKKGKKAQATAADVVSTMQARVAESRPPGAVKAGPSNPEVDLAHKNAKVITRLALRHMMPTWKAVLAKVHKKLTVTEPTYKDILTLYRKKVHPPTAKQLKANPQLGVDFRMAQRNIVIKRFDELPLADIEILLPDKTVNLKLVDLLTLYLTALAAIIGGITAFFGASVEFSVIMSTMGVMGGKLMQTYTSMQSKKANLVKQMSLKVYDISLDAQEGVLFSILDEMADQYVKEMLLAYFILHKSPDNVSKAELDGMCEDFLEDKFDIKIDFAMDDSLPRLMQTGLISKSELDDSLQAAPLAVANELLLNKWNRAFSYDESETASLTSAFKSGAGGAKGLGSGITKGISHMTDKITNIFGGGNGGATSSAAKPPPPPPSPAGVERSAPSVSKRKWFGKKKVPDGKIVCHTADL